MVKADFIVVGTGAGGLVGAISAKLNGLNPVIIEKTASWGGTSALSGGGVWIPNNHLMQRDGVEDSYEAAFAYMEATIGDVGPSSSSERKAAYLNVGPEMVQALEAQGLCWRRAPRYPDYHQDQPGARVGRTLEGVSFDGKKLGGWLETMRKSDLPSMVMSTDDAPKIPTMFRSFKSLSAAIRMMGRTLAWYMCGRKPLSMGATLVAQLMAIVQRLEIPVLLDTPLKSLIQEGGRIVGVVTGEGETEQRFMAPHGVLLTTGGFAKNSSYRKQFQEVSGEWSSASPGDTGDGHQIGASVGAELALMDAATWYPISILPDGTFNVGIWERTLPGSIIVDASGQRYTNEAASYVNAGRAMLDRDKSVGAVPSWLIFDNRYRSRYFFGSTPPGMNGEFLKSGAFTRASTLGELADACGIDADGLKRTVERVNAMAEKGVDEDFGRGDNVYDQYYGDPGNRPNPSFGPIDQAPFYATRFYPGDLSTKGGLMADEHARVLRQDGSVIEGLYAAGNCAAPVMGRTYPGAGATLGPAMVFAWIAGRHGASNAG
ncbi:FAD-binding protein [Sphingobium vermicomposti]|uniref:3-oxosteroid 1-dehydrogenase n=1 Tax=Sphingobium vermicomposti TaxID=529005 RepID=A0A846M6Y0_9SPHN|nr:FAD-binding protein [Sphingobium vermicomposti]NIJ17619.1 3-oxosteroid 1-dehydrogenase [Sphingobium vermicomposti]